MLCPCHSSEGWKAQQIGKGGAQVHVSSDGIDSLTSGEEPRIPEDQRDIYVLLICSKPWPL